MVSFLEENLGARSTVRPVGRSADDRAPVCCGDAQRARERGHHWRDTVHGRRAILFGDAGRLDDAFEYLDQAIAARDPALVYLSVAPHGIARETTRDSINASGDRPCLR